MEPHIALVFVTPAVMDSDSAPGLSTFPQEANEAIRAKRQKKI
jgi:hypothetical protein